MSQDQINDAISHGLLAVGSGSWGVLAFFETVSHFFQLLLPITGFLSFLIYLLLNYEKIYAKLIALAADIQSKRKSKTTSETKDNNDTK